MIFFIFYFILIFLFLFVPLEHLVFLTVNEEIFIIISFFIFIDLFGYKLINSISNFTNSVQLQVYKQFFLVYVLQLQAFLNLTYVYMNLTRLFKISKFFNKKLYIELHKLDLQRQLDFKFFVINFLTFQNRALSIFENQFLFIVFKIFKDKELPLLEEDLVKNSIQQKNNNLSGIQNIDHFSDWYVFDCLVAIFFLNYNSNKNI
jgi:hypothetical protein